MLKLKFIYFFFLITLVQGQLETTVVDSCNAGTPLPINVFVDGCTATPCSLVVGEDVDIYITFKSPTTTKALTTKATAYIVIAIPYDLGDQSNSCPGLLNTYCPVMKDEVVLYKLIFHVDSSFPALAFTLPVEMYVENDDGEVIACFRVGISLTNSRNHNANNVTMIASEIDIS